MSNIMPEPSVVPDKPLSLSNLHAKIPPPNIRQEWINEQFEQYNLKVRKAKEVRRLQQLTPRNPKVVTQLYCNLCEMELTKFKPKKLEGFAIDISIPVWKCEICLERFEGFGHEVTNTKGQSAIVSSLELL